MKITKEELVKALKECGFQVLNEGNLLVIHEDGEKIDRFLEVLEKIPERKEEIKPHKHNWQFTGKKVLGTGKYELFKGNDIKTEIKKIYLEFVCECGATKRVLEKEVEL